MDLTQKLKEKVVSRFLKFGDDKALLIGKKTYTGNEIAKEIEDETEFGVETINKLLKLTIDLVARGKIST